MDAYRMFVLIVMGLIAIFLDNRPMHAKSMFLVLGDLCPSYFQGIMVLYYIHQKPHKRLKSRIEEAILIVYLLAFA